MCFLFALFKACPVYERTECLLNVWVWEVELCFDQQFFYLIVWFEFHIFDASITVELLKWISIRKLLTSNLCLTLWPLTVVGVCWSSVAVDKYWKLVVVNAQRWSATMVVRSEVVMDDNEIWLSSTWSTDRPLVVNGEWWWDMGEWR